MMLFSIFFSLMVPIVTLLYEIGDRKGWWDRWRGRYLLLSGLERIQSPKGYPTVVILEGEPEFKKMADYLIERSQNRQLRFLREANKLPTGITRLGGGEVKTPIPAGWPPATFVPDSSPIVLIYGTKDDKLRGEINRAASIQEVKDWVESEKRIERFWVTVILINMLALAVLIPSILQLVGVP